MKEEIADLREEHAIRDVRDRLERVLLVVPGAVGDHERAQHARRDERIRATKDAGLHAALEDLADESLGSAHDLDGVELVEVGKVPAV